MVSEPLLSPPPPASTAPAASRRRRWLAWGLGSATLALALVIAAGAGAWWALHSGTGSAWLLRHVPGLQVSGVQGSLLGDLQAEQVVIALPREGKVTLTGFRWRGLQVERGRGAAWARLRFESLQAGRVDIQPGKASPDPTVAPTDLSLPIELEVASLQVQALYIAGAGDVPVRDLQARLHLGAQAGTQHRIELAGASYDQLKASASATLGTGGALPLDLNLQLVQTAPLANAQWSAQATLAGPLTAARLQATLRAQPAPTADGKPVPAQALDLSALLHPFEAWPLGDLDARADALDLQAFLASAPRTALSGQAQVRSSGLGQTAIITASLRNAEAGLWSAGRLPLRQLDLDLRGRPGDPGTLTVQRFDAELGSQATVAGRIAGQGRWARDGWGLEMALAALQPDQLDARAAAMLLSGPVKLSGTAPGSAAAQPTQVAVRAELTGRAIALATGPAKAASRARPAAAASAASAASSRPAASSAASRTERGAAAGNGVQRDVSLRLDAIWTNDSGAQRIELREALASTGAARASASGTAERAAPDGSPWRLRGQAALSDFDPVPWWPGREDSPWRQGQHRLNAKGDFDLTLPSGSASVAGARSGTAAAPATPPAGATFAAWRGRTSVTLRDSVLAGVALSGELSLRATEGNPAEAQLQLDAAGNQLRASGRVATRTGATDDHWEARVNAPSLDQLAPLWRLLRPAGAEASLAGTLNGNLVVDGRWPVLESRGEAQAAALRVDTLTVQRADASWRMSSRADSPMEARVTLADIAVGGATVDRTELRLDGTGRAHRLSLQAESKALPPAWVDGVQKGVQGAASAASAASAPTPATPAPLRGRSVASLEAQGGLFDNTAGALAGWRGALQQLELRSADPQAAPWLRTRDVNAQLQWADASGEGPLQITLQPGRAELLGAALRWERVDWRAADGAGVPARIEAQAELEPFAVAPLLQRLQPDFGWGGDLLVTGRLEIRSAPTFHADVVLERSRGDLSVTDEVGTQALGLSDLRLGLNVADGVWSFTQGLAGSSLGVAAGALVARTTPDASWPAPQTPVSGVLELQVANLGTWGTWVPAGWRLGGALRVGATIAGTFGAPEYVGELTGRELSVRNFLQGVNVTDGDVAIKLQGTSARIERFSAKAGSGSVRLEGGATFGTAPQVLIDLTAEQFTLLGRVDRRIVTSGAAKLRLDREALALTGQFGIDEGLIDFSRSDAPSLSDDVTVLRPAPGAAPRATVEAAGSIRPAAEAAGSIKPAAEAASAPKPAVQLSGKTALDLRVNLGQRLRLRGRGIDTGLRGELRITSPSSRVAVNGTVSTADGTYQAYGQKLTIDRGELSFNGPVENPRLDIEATRPNLDVRVGVAVSGTAVNPRIRLFSEPELSEIDKLSWLVLGRASDGLGRADTALLQRAAVALLSGEGDGVTDQFTRAIGLDEVSLRQTEGEVRETIVSLGKQLSRRWYVGYERGLNATAGTWQLIYRIAQRFTLRAQSGLDNSLDVIWTWRWN